MFDKKYDEQVNALLLRFADWQRGSVIPWKEIELAMGRGRNEEGGWIIINRFRKQLLRDREIVTLAKDTVGVRLLTNEEAAFEIPRLRQKRAYRQVNRGLRETAAINQTELSDRLRLVLMRQRENMARQRLEIGRSRREKYRLGRKSPTMPVRQLVHA
jgi:hypothetical protein